MCISIKIKEVKNRLDFDDLYSPIVCGNSNYELKFDFDDEWKRCSVKTAIFVVDGKKAIVKFHGDTVKVPTMPNAPYVVVSLQGYVEDEMILNSTGIKIALQESPGLSDLQEFEPLQNYFTKIVGAINRLENGEIEIKDVKHAEYADKSGMSETQVDLTSDQNIYGVKNFEDDVKVKGQSLGELAAKAEKLVDTESEQTISGTKTFAGDVFVGSTNLNEFLEGASSGASYLNPNVLLNPNFKINQRGKKVYSGDGYTVDRWLGYEGLTVTPLANGVRLESAGKKSSSSENLFVQKFEEGFETFAGRAMTLSCKIDGELYSATAEIPKTNDCEKTFISVDLGSHSDAESNFLYFKIDGDGVVSVAFDLSDGASFNLEYVKLEFGESATEFCPPNYTDELNRCKRYYFESGGTYIYNYAFTMSYIYDSNIKFAVPMRKVPEVSFFCYQTEQGGKMSGERIDGRIWCVNRKEEVSSFDVFSVSNENLVVSNNEGDLYTGSLYSCGIVLDAEIY